MNDLTQQFNELEGWLQLGILALLGVIGLLLLLLLFELLRSQLRALAKRRRSDTHQGYRDDEETKVYDTGEREALHKELHLTEQEGEGDETLFCQHCGTPNLADATYCQTCGVAMDMTMVRHQLGWREGQVILSVGRRSGSTIVLHDLMVSQEHAQFRFWKGTLTVQDAGSSNGTYINNHRVSDAVMVIRGDQLRFGHTTMSFDQVITVLSREIGQRKQTFREGDGL